ncbi:MAG: acyl-CoA thioesterase [Vibrio sp.]
MSQPSLKTTTQIQIAWGEMDAFHHVNNAVYFRYFESARIEFFQRIELIETLAPMHIIPVVSETSCRYKAPLTFPDTIKVTSSICHLADDHFVMQYDIYSEKLERITTTGKATVMLFDTKHKTKAKLPDAILQRLDQQKPTLGSQ